VFKIEHIPSAFLIPIRYALSKSVVGAISYTSNIFNHEQQRQKPIFYLAVTQLEPGFSNFTQPFLMELRSKITAFFTGVAILLIASCKKDASTQQPPVSGGTILDKEAILDSTSGSISTLQYTYNSSGDLFSINSKSPNGGDTMTYSSPGKLLKYKAGNAWEVMMVYDSNGLITSVKSTSTQTNFPRVFTYDNRSRVVADTSFDDTGKVVFYNSFSYDNDDNIISYQEVTVSQTGDLYTDGPVTVTYDHHRNPHARFGKWIYYADGDFRYLFKENSISEKAGSFEEKTPTDVVYRYYSDGQLWQASSSLYHLTIAYYYK
jgi:hypothetical protein